MEQHFNTADPAPGSTHNDTLMALVDEIWNMGAKSVSLGERSYPLTREVMAEKGILPHYEWEKWQIFKPTQMVFIT